MVCVIISWFFSPFHMIMCDFQWRIHVRLTNEPAGSNEGDNYN